MHVRLEHLLVLRQRLDQIGLFYCDPRKNCAVYIIVCADLLVVLDGRTGQGFAWLYVTAGGCTACQVSRKC